LQEALKSKKIKKNAAAYADGTRGIKPYGYNELSLSKGGVVPSTMAYLDDGICLGPLL
jgi:hypothetical protein